MKASPAVRFGAMLPTIGASGILSPEELLRYVATGNEAGLDSFWAGDHLNWHTPVLECLTTLGFVAGHTRAVLGTNVLIGALRHPVIIARVSGTLSHLTGGQFRLGLGVGGEHPKEFEAVGVPLYERGRRTDEIIDVLRRLWKEPQVSHRGRFYDIPSAQLEPRPGTHGIPIYVGGRSEAALGRVVTRGDGWTAAWLLPEQYCRTKAKLHDLARRHGRCPGSVETIVHTYVHLHPDEETGRSEGGRFLARFYNADPAPFERHCVAGPPDIVAARLVEYLDVGVNELLVYFAGARPIEQLTIYAEEVLPVLRGHLAGRVIR
ncbi:MAG: LLM class flavin-dependent oxidoreductase [Actinomycetota bacterium]|jgi:alkanesulfonate monooxygenase SsuD/methylene tetrahydromethanopterin reductase-like flavin-dependent oxidoreductase (luciferase family)